MQRCFLPSSPLPSAGHDFSGETADKAHRVLATFMWCFFHETMRRTNLSWSVERGGLGLINTKIKLPVQWLLFFGDTEDRLIRIVLQHFGGGFLAGWQVSSPDHVVGIRPLYFYSEIAGGLLSSKTYSHGTTSLA